MDEYVAAFHGLSSLSSLSEDLSEDVAEPIWLKDLRLSMPLVRRRTPPALLSAAPAAPSNRHTRAARLLANVLPVPRTRRLPRRSAWRRT